MIWNQPWSSNPVETGARQRISDRGNLHALAATFSYISLSLLTTLLDLRNLRSIRLRRTRTQNFNGRDAQLSVCAEMFVFTD